MKVSYNMSNAELAYAITEAYNRSGTGSTAQQMNAKQLEALLAIQKQRALSVTVVTAPWEMIKETFTPEGGRDVADSLHAKDAAKLSGVAGSVKL